MFNTFMLRSIFWVFTLMIPFISFIGYINYVNEHWWLFAMNVATVITSAFNIYSANKNIKRVKKIEKEYMWRLLGGKVNEI